MSFIEMRKYRLVIGGPPKWKKLYNEQGYEIQRKYLGEPVGYYLTEFGGVNEVIHMWRYDSLEDRVNKRAGLTSDPKWGEFISQVAPLIETQETAILSELLD